MLDLNEIVNKIKIIIKNVNESAFKRKKKSNFILIEDSPEFIMIETPKIISKHNNDFNIEKIKEEYRKYLEEFIMTMKEKLPEELLTTMYNNLSTLDICNVTQLKIIRFIIEKMTGSMISAGTYNGITNKIRLDAQSENALYTFKQLIFHELFHMSSSVRNKRGAYCGFEHLYYNIEFPQVSVLGFGINEGYTDLLTEKFFQETGIKIIEEDGSYYSINTNSVKYEIYSEISRITESIIGEEKMISLYFQSNLKGLIDELSKYSKEQETMMFIYNLDNNRIANCIKYLNEIYLNKITSELKSNIITRHQAIEKIRELLTSIYLIHELTLSLNKLDEAYEINECYNEVISTEVNIAREDISTESIRKI